MKQKMTKGSNFRGLLTYLLKEKAEKEKKELTKDERQPEELTHHRNIVSERNPLVSKEIPEEAKKLRGRIVGGNMDGQTIDELTEEFESLRALRPEISKPVDHVSLSAAQEERLSDDTWRKIAYIYNKKTGFERSMYVAVRHEDTAMDHIHIARSRIDFDGKLISDSNDYEQGEKAVQYLERKFKLQESIPSKETMRRAPTRGELELEKKTGRRSIKSRLQDLLDLALTGKPTVTQMIKRLETAGVDVRFHLKDGGPAGVLFRLDGEVMKGTDLGRAYSWPGLQKSWTGHSERGLSYEYERDIPAILRSTECAATRSDHAANKGREKGIIARLDQGRSDTEAYERDRISTRGEHESNSATREVRNLDGGAGDTARSRRHDRRGDRTFSDWLNKGDRSFEQSENGADREPGRNPTRDRDFPPRAGEASLDGQEDTERTWTTHGRGEESSEISIRDSPGVLQKLPAPDLPASSPSSLGYDYRGSTQRLLSIMEAATGPQHHLELRQVGDLHKTDVPGAKEGVGGQDRQDNAREGSADSIEVNDYGQPNALHSPADAFEAPNADKEVNKEMGQVLDDLIL